jgi:hypothetical protein
MFPEMSVGGAAMPNLEMLNKAMLILFMGLMAICAGHCCGEDQNKETSPAKSGEHGVRKVSQIRVWFGDESWKNVPSGKSPAQACMFFTDSKQESFSLYVGVAEAQAIQPWLEGHGSQDALDIHTALARALTRFGCEIKSATITELKDGTYYAALKLQAGGRLVDVDCRPSDAVNLAVRCNAPVFVSEEVVQQSVLTGDDGKPMPPAEAWGKFANYRSAFNTLLDVLRALEAYPDSRNARGALTALRNRCTPPKILDTDTEPQRAEGFKMFEVWVDSCAGTKLEAVSAGLLGGLYLWPLNEEGCDLGAATEWLEKAHKLAPKDTRITFDLATAYAQAGRSQEALGTLDKLVKEYPRANEIHRVKECKNFEGLWANPRFRSLFGPPTPEAKYRFVVAQIMDILYQGHPGWGSSRKKPEAAGPSGVSGPAFRKEMAKISPEEIGRLAAWLKCSGLRPIASASQPYGQPGMGGGLVLEVEKGRGIRIPQDEVDRSGIDRALKEVPSPRPLTHTAFCKILDAAGIQLETVVLTKRSGADLEALLVAKQGQRREAIPIAGLAALSIAFTAKCPILISEALAEKI